MICVLLLGFYMNSIGGCQIIHIADKIVVIFLRAMIFRAVTVACRIHPEVNMQMLSVLMDVGHDLIFILVVLDEKNNSDNLPG